MQRRSSFRPVFVTLVSTGIDGAGDPATTHSTIQGQFLIHTKHVTTTMDGDEAGDEFDLREVPYVQYFNDGFALHAAYWHDAFGAPRSYGCVNLSPLDARWLFAWTEPHVAPPLRVLALKRDADGTRCFGLRARGRSRRMTRVGPRRRQRPGWRRARRRTELPRPTYPGA